MSRNIFKVSRNVATDHNMSENAYTILVRKYENKRLVLLLRHKWEYTIKIGRITRVQIFGLVRVVQYRQQERNLMDIGMNYFFHKRPEIS